MRAFELRALDGWNRLRLAWLRQRHPGLQVDRAASSNFAVARYNLGPGARLTIAAGAVTERIPKRLSFVLYPGARVEIEERAWLRTEIGDLHLVVFEGAHLRIGPETLLNGCHVSAKTEVVIGRRSMLGPGTRVFDSDQHDFDAERKERSEPVHVGECVWVSSDCTILRGSRIGDHSIVGTGSLVNGEVAPHTLVFGRPARERGVVGDRSETR